MSTTKQPNLLLLVSLIIIVCSCKWSSDFTVDPLTCNHFFQPLGVESQQPLLSWQVKSENNEKSQTAYHVLVSQCLDDLTNEKGAIWDSGKVISTQSVNVPYLGKPLESGKRYFWKVKVWDESDQESDWSEPTFWQMGLLDEGAWSNAKWITFELLDSTKRLVPGVHGFGNHLGEIATKRPVIPMFRKTFQVKEGLALATLCISGLGHYEAYVNGEKAGNSFLSPGWTDYEETVLYNNYNVTSMLKPGQNVLGAIVGNGFYNINRERYRKLVIAYGMPEMISHLKLDYADGSSEIIVSDESWRMAPSPITFASIYSGEDYDARLEQTDWSKPEFQDSRWQPVLLSKGPSGKLSAEKNYPLKTMEILPVQKISRLKDGSYLYDFGQNASGIVEVKVKGQKGQQVKLWPTELINADSTCNQKATGSPYYYAYTLKGDSSETWQPRFTYYGFRYVQVFGAVPGGEKTQGLPVIEKMDFLHIRNSAPANGTFSCSNELLNKVHILIDWAIKSNLQSVVTDCPHREKLGWLEQTFLMGGGIHFSYENYHLYRKLVFDMIDAQTTDGLVPDIAPEYVEFKDGFRDSPEWGSASIVLPYLLYKWYGDEQIIDEAWSMMMKYANYLRAKSNGHILDYGLGDWFDLGPKRPGVAQLTPVALTATAIYYYDLKLLAEMAVVRHRDEKDLLRQWAEEIRTAFNLEFYNPEAKVYSTGSQTAMSMPLCFEVVEEKDREEVFANLVDSIIAGDKALTAGDVGFHYLVEALTKGGASQLLFDMINRDDVPGYGFQLKKGATALTESWQALEEVSNNHLMLGHVMEWFYAGLAGIGQSENSVAFKEFEINPQIVGDITFVKASFRCPYGVIRSEWRRTDTAFDIEVEIPFNTTAKIYLPTGDLASVKVNGKKVKKEILPVHTEKGNIELQVGSGIYRIQSKLTILN